MASADNWEAYKVLKHETMGFAYAKWNKQGQFWQQCTKWYAKFGNLKRHVLKHYGHHLM